MSNGQGPYPPHGGPGYPPPPGQPGPYGGPPGPGGWGGPPPPRSSNTGVIIAVVGLIVIAIGVGLTLWMTGVFDRSSSQEQSYNNVAPVPVGPTTDVSGNPAPPAAAGVSRDWLLGQWGPNCPASADGGFALNSDGTIVAARGTGTWSLNGDTVTATGGGRTDISTWTYLSQNSARVTIQGSTRVLNRCTSGAPGTSGPDPVSAPPPISGSSTPRLVSGSISDADYPPAAMRASAQGTVTASVQVGSDGRVAACSITGSSGNAALDSTTCGLIQRRYRYTPPAGTVQVRVVWRLPD